MNKSFEQITIVNVDGRYGELAHAQYALQHSASQLPGSKMLLISPTRPSNLLPGIDHYLISPMGYTEYSLFIIYALHNFVATEFALIIQDDGWILGGENWDDSYFDYDFIGAPTHFARLTNRNTNIFVRNFKWTAAINNPLFKIDYAMNGGFSLRSKRMLRAPSVLKIPFIISVDCILEGPPYYLKYESGSNLEDVQLTINMKKTLELAGLHYPPLKLARKFAFEHLDPTLHKNVNLCEVFGHHSKLRKIVSLKPLKVEFQQKKEEVKKIPGELLVVEIFKQRGYEVGYL